MKIFPRMSGLDLMATAVGVLMLTFWVIPAALELYVFYTQSQFKDVGSGVTFRLDNTAGSVTGDTAAIEVIYNRTSNTCVPCTTCPMMEKDFLTGINPEKITRGTLIYEKDGRAYVLAVRVK